jgi:hypothetical protein
MVGCVSKNKRNVKCVLQVLLMQMDVLEKIEGTTKTLHHLWYVLVRYRRRIMPNYSITQDLSSVFSKSNSFEI